MDIVLVDHSQPLLPEQVWVTRERFVLTMQEKEIILQREKLNDWIVNVVQQLLHKQFPHLVRLQLTLCQSKKQSKVIPSM